MQRRGKHALNYMDLMEPTAISPEDEAKWLKNHLQKTKQRLYVSWRNTKGNDCKMIGPQTKCFCSHRFKQHNSTPTPTHLIPCTSKCPCKSFYYIPTHGAYDFKCLCKHSYKQHDAVTRKCKRPKCLNCNKFSSTWTCSCEMKFVQHETVVETFQERKMQGRFMGDMERMAEEMNGVEKEGGLMNPAEKHSPISRSVEVKGQKGQKGPRVEENMTSEQRKKEQLSRLNKMLIAEKEPAEEIKQQIEEVDGEVPMLNLYTQPHHYRKVSAELRKITR